METNYKLPEIGKIYYHYDDGKIKESRQEKVRIVDIIKYDDAPDEYKKKFKEESEEHTWIYKAETPYFIVGESIDFPEAGTPIYALTHQDNWFSFTLEDLFWPNEGLLDIEGNLLEEVNKE